MSCHQKIITLTKKKNDHIQFNQNTELTIFRYLAAAGEPKAGGCAGQGGDSGGGGVGGGRRGGGGGQPVQHKLAFPHSLGNLRIRNTTSSDFSIRTRPS